MSNFVSWATELERAKNALASRSWNEYFVSSVENSKEMRTTFTRMGNIIEFIQWLERKAAEEQMGSSGPFFNIGGN